MLMNETLIHVSQLVACTWGGRIFVVANPDSVVHFRILYPASFMFCGESLSTSSSHFSPMN